jgi:hypothetical protein
VLTPFKQEFSVRIDNSGTKFCFHDCRAGGHVQLLHWVGVVAI